MKHLKILISLLVVVGFIAFPAISVKASGPAGSWSSGIACQNLDPANAADVTLDFYNADGTKAITYGPDASTAIAAGGSRNWLTTSASNMPGFPSAFTGSGVISSDRQLACNVNTQTAGTGIGTTTNPYRMGTNSGLSDTTIAPVIYIAQAVKIVSVPIYSYISVQNTGSAPTAVHMKYYLGTGAEVTAAAETYTIPAYSSKIFYQSDNTNLPVDFNGGAKVSADDGVTPLGVSVAVFYGGTSPSTAMFFSLNGVTAGAARVFAPSFYRNMVGYNSGIAIQNVGSANTYAKVTFTFIANDAGTDVRTYVFTTPVIAPSASYLIYAPSFAPLADVDTIPVIHRLGSAVIETVNSTGTPTPADRVAVIVNLDNKTKYGGDALHAGQGSTYNAANDGSQTTTVFFPQFTRWVLNKLNSGFTVSNTTGTAGTCTITYAPDAKVSPAFAGTTETGVVLPANGNFSRYAPNVTALPAGYNAAVTVKCTQPVIGVVNLSASNKLGNNDVYGDSSTQNMGINQ